MAASNFRCIAICFFSRFSSASCGVGATVGGGVGGTTVAVPPAALPAPFAIPRTLRVLAGAVASRYPDGFRVSTGKSVDVLIQRHLQLPYPRIGAAATENGSQISALFSGASFVVDLLAKRRWPRRQQPIVNFFQQQAVRVDYGVLKVLYMQAYP